MGRNEYNEYEDDDDGHWQSLPLAPPLLQTRHPTYLPTYETAGPLLLLRWNGLTLATNAFYTRGYYYVFSNTFIIFGSCTVYDIIAMPKTT